jgi:hypothetical protein
MGLDRTWAASHCNKLERVMLIVRPTVILVGVVLTGLATIQREICGVGQLHLSKESEDGCRQWIGDCR